MRVAILAVGRLGHGPEATLARTYVKRAAAIGRRLGVHPVELHEVQPRKVGREAEGEALLAQAASSPGTRLLACDEHGRAFTSRGFADRIATLRDQGAGPLAFAVGGADGLAQAVLDAADERVAFGPQTWPHALARVMLAEQLYRAMTLLAKTPYHRD